MSSARVIKALAALAVAAAVTFVLWKLFFADIQRRVTQEKGGRVVAEEQVGAEANIADGTITAVRERDVYRERITTVVREAQERVNAADKGQQMDPAIDAAVADGLCGVHISLCREVTNGVDEN